MWFYLALSSALISAFSITLNKKLLKSLNTSVVTLMLFLIPVPIIVVYFLIMGLPKFNLAFLLSALIAASVFAIAKMLGLKALKEKEITKVTPLAVFSTLFQYLLGLFILSEGISLIRSFGIVVVLIGAYMLNLSKAKEGWLDPFKVMFKDKFTVFYLVATLLTAICSIFEKYALLNTFPQSPLLLLLAENTVMSVVVGG